MRTRVEPRHRRQPWQTPETFGHLRSLLWFWARKYRGLWLFCAVGLILWAVVLWWVVKP